MATLKEQLNTALKDALRSGDAERKATLRGALASIKQAEVDGQAELDEAGLVAAVQKEVKAQRELQADAERGGRAELVAAAKSRITILEEFLPQQLSRAEIEDLARAAIAETGADSPRQMGAVMKTLMPQVRGRADGKLVSSIVSELLQSNAG